MRLVVVDSGKGMDTATLARVCEPFFTTKEPGLGTGLGLAMAKVFAEQSGGALNIESRPGRGTTVTLWLPAADADTSHDRAVEPEEVMGMAASGPGMPTGSVRLMVVEDETLNREVLAEHLENAGFGVLAAANGTEALALLARGEAVDALITDLSMPGMDGIAVIRAAQERCPGLPAVLLTGYAGDDISLAVGGAVIGAFSLLRKHAHGEYARDEDGDGCCEVDVNTIEGFWSLLRSWLTSWTQGHGSRPQETRSHGGRVAPRKSFRSYRTTVAAAGG